MPEQFESADLTPLSREPLLLYFLAFAEVWDQQSGEGRLNRNAVYDQVLRKFHTRECQKDHHSLGKRFGDFDNEFEPVLQSLALAAWYDGSTRKGNIDDAFAALLRINHNLLVPLKDHLGKEPAFGASLAFHLRPLDGKNTYEFLHKSFAEYLVARRFIKAIIELPELLKPRAGKPLDAETTLKDWIEEWGVQAIDHDLHRFVRDEAKFCVERNNLVFSDCRHYLSGLLRYAEIFGMPAHKLLGLEKASMKISYFSDMTEWARNAEESLFVALDACVRFEPEGMDTVNLWNHSLGIGDMVSRVLRQRDQGFIGGSCLSRLNMAGAHLFGANLSNANLEGANLEGANLYSSNLSSANLEHVHRVMNRWPGDNASGF